MPNIERKGRFTGHLVTASLRQRVNALTLAAEKARSIRAVDKVNTIADELLEIVPYRLSAVAAYYKAIALNNSGVGSPESTALLLVLTESHLPQIRGRASLALSVQSMFARDYSLSVRRYETAFRELTFENDPLGTLHLGNLHAALLSERGQHEEAASKLQTLVSIATVTRFNLQTLVYNLWNSLAIEMLYLGHVETAKKISSKIVESSHVSAYPEWMQTRDQIEKADYKARSVSLGRPSATIHNLQQYREARIADADQLFLASIEELYLRSQRVDIDTKRFLTQSIEVLLHHTAQHAGPPTAQR